MEREKPKPMSAEARKKGREFVAALLEEKRTYKTMLDDFRLAVVLEALSREKNVPQRAAKLTGMSGQNMRMLLRLAGLKVTTVLEERVSA